MDWLSIVQLAIQYGPIVKGILDAGVSNQGIVATIKQDAAPVAPLLERIGSQLMPKAAPTLHVLAGAIAAFDPNTTKWLQGSLNALLSPSPNLVVDGKYGPKTVAAVETLQAQLGLKVDGLAGQLTQAAISAALAKLPNL